MCRRCDSRGEQARPQRIEERVGLRRLAVRMNSRAEDYRRRALQVKQRAAQITDLRLKEAFRDIARHWLALAEREAWLDQHSRNQQRD
jgi:hypothetical protein